MSDDRKPTETARFVGGKLQVMREGTVVTLFIDCLTEYRAIEYYERIVGAARDGRVDLSIETRSGNVGC